MTVLPLPDELLMLGFDDAVGRPLVPGIVLDLGLAGAVLIELLLAGRLTVRDERVFVTDARPVDDPIAEAALDKIRSAAEPHEVRRWVPDLAKGVREQILGRLVATGVVERAETLVLGLFRRVRYPLLNPAPETAAQLRLDVVIRHREEPGRHTAALAIMVHAIGLGPKLYPDLPATLVRERFDAIVDADWGGAEIKEAVTAVYLAVESAASAVAINTAVAGSFA